MKTLRPTIGVTLRLPPELYQRLKREARKSGITMTALIILKLSVEAKETSSA